MTDREFKRRADLLSRRLNECLASEDDPLVALAGLTVCFEEQFVPMRVVDDPEATAELRRCMFVVLVEMIRKLQTTPGKELI